MSINLAGETFHRLTAIKHSQGAYWRCVCVCGKTRFVRASNLRRGITKSCGCLRTDMLKKRVTKHGWAKTKNPPSEYRIWMNMKDRCRNPNNQEFHNYGGRGIAVCNEWKASFLNFLGDMGLRPSPNHTLERKNNSLGYSKTNCRWALPVDQANNTRANRLITYKNVTRTMAQWARFLRVSYWTFARRLNALGWSAERAIETPVNAHRTK